MAARGRVGNFDFKKAAEFLKKVVTRTPLSSDTKIIGVEPEGAPAMYEAIKAVHPVTLPRQTGLLTALYSVWVT